MDTYKETCKICSGTGLLADDEGWQYACSICHGQGLQSNGKSTRILSVDPNNRLLD